MADSIDKSAVPAKRKPSRRYSGRRDAIIASAVAVINRKGVRGMTLADVAERLDLVPTGVIYYFKNKEELAVACFERAIDRFNGLIAEAAAADGARARVESFIDGFIDYKRRSALGQAERIAVFNDVRALNNPGLNAAYVDMFRRARALFPSAAFSRPEQNARTHLLLSQAFWAVVWLPRFDPEDYPRAASRTADILMNGLAAPGARWPSVSLPDLAPATEGDPSAELFLRAATELINEQGYLGASVEKISARLNVTKGAFYHRHDAKDDLVLACFERTFQVVRQAIRTAEASASNGYERLAAAASALVEYQISGNAPLLRTSALTSVPEPLQEELVRKFDRLSDRLAGIICDGVADGSVRPVEVNVAAQLITAMINAAAELKYWAPGVVPQNAAALYVRPLFEGLLTPKA